MQQVDSSDPSFSSTCCCRSIIASNTKHNLFSRRPRNQLKVDDVDEATIATAQLVPFSDRSHPYGPSVTPFLFYSIFHRTLLPCKEQHTHHRQTDVDPGHETEGVEHDSPSTSQCSASRIHAARSSVHFGVSSGHVSRRVSLSGRRCQMTIIGVPYPYCFGIVLPT